MGGQGVGARWYPDPTGRQQLRYFDGARWTEHASSAGAQVTDALADGGTGLPPPGQAPPVPPAAPWTQPPPRAAGNRPVWPWVVGGALLLFGALFAGCAALIIVGAGETVDEITDEIEERREEALADVTGSDASYECVRDDAGFPAARGMLRNHSSGRSDYRIEVTFEDAAGAQFGTGVASVRNVAPGQDARWEASSLRTLEGEFSCEVVDVDRSASI